MSDNAQRSRDILEFFIKSSYMFTRRRTEANLTVREIKLLHILQEERGRNISVGELSKRMELTMPATSKLLKSLETKEMILRTADDTDRRTILVCITPKGLATIENGWRSFCESIDAIVEYMGDEQADAFISLSKVYLDALHHAGYLPDKEESSC